MIKNIVLLVSVVFLFGCQTPSRQLAAVEPAQIESGSDFFLKKKEIQIHDGSLNNWKAGKLNLKKMKFVTAEDAQAILTHLDGLLAADKNKSIDLPKSSKRTLKELQNALKGFIQAPASEVDDLKNQRALIFNLVATFNYNFQTPVK